MSTEAHTVHIGTLNSGAIVGQLAVRTAYLMFDAGRILTLMLRFRLIQHGLMGLTWTANTVTYEQAFEAIKAGIDSLPPGVRMFLNSGM